MNHLQRKTHKAQARELSDHPDNKVHSGTSRENIREASKVEPILLFFDLFMLATIQVQVQAFQLQYHR